MFTLWSLIEASLLCLNAVCILHEERFMNKGNGVAGTEFPRLKHVSAIFLKLNSENSLLSVFSWLGLIGTCTRIR